MATIMLMLTLGAASAWTSNDQHRPANDHQRPVDDEDSIAMVQTVAVVTPHRESALGSPLDAPTAAKVDAVRESLLTPDLGAPCNSEVIVIESGMGAGSYCTIAGDEFGEVTQALSSGVLYEAETHERIAGYLKHGLPGDVIVAGLFIGDYLPHMSQAVKLQHRVYGFEPSKEYLEAARGTVFASGLDNIFIANAGLSNQSGAMEIPEGGRQGQTTFASTAVRLDDVLPSTRRIGVIVLDVEGFELEALHGAEQLIKQWRPLIICETFNEDGIVKQMMRFLGAFGYEANEYIEHDWNTVFVARA